MSNSHSSTLFASIKGRIAIITGASAGIGKAIAEDLASMGVHIVLNARRAEKLAELKADLTARFGSTGAKFEVVAGDAADEATIVRMLDVARSALGGGTREANLIVVNAGRGLGGSVVESDRTQWEEMLRTNVLGAALLIRHSAKRMMADLASDSNHGRTWQDQPRDIVVLGSTVGRHVSPFSSMYGGTKFAVHGMTEGVRRELAGKGIRVTLIEPGFVVSEFQGVAGYDPAWVQNFWDRVGPVLTPADVSRSVVFTVAQPAAVHVSDIMLRPTRQDYP
jgi:NADP-dependent 3-hydroxy acid dehydrogenase YdfG